MIETNIPYDYKDENVAVPNIIKVEVLERYKDDKFPLSLIQKYGIKSIRGPRYLTKECSELINQ